MKKYLKPIIISAFLFALIFSFSASSVKAMSTVDLQAQINALTAQLKVLQQQLQSQLTETPAPVAWCHTFNNALRVGDYGPEVDMLVTALSKEGFFSTIRTYPSFDEYIASVVVEFQEKYASEVLKPYGLKRGTGYVGKSTRAKLNQLYGCGNTQPTTPTTPVTPTVPVDPPTQPSAQSSACPDFNKDGIINLTDSNLFVNCVFSGKNCNDYNFDLNGDGALSVKGDTPFFAKAFGKKASEIEACGGTSQPAIQPTVNTSVSGGATFPGSATYVSVNGGTPIMSNGPQTSLNIGDTFVVTAGQVVGYTAVLTGTCTLGTPGAQAGQNYSCNIAYVSSSTTQPSITVLSPNGGEQWEIGETHALKWTSNTDLARVVIDILNSQGKSVDSGLPAVIANNKTINWTIPANMSAGQYKMKVMICPDSFTDLSCANVDLKQYGYDNSNNHFMITKPATVNTCKDTDNGVDYYLKGYASGGIGSTQKAEDMCGADGYLYEYYCHVNNNSINYLKYKCPYGCSDGACKKNDTDLEIKSITKDSSSPYLFSTNVCVVGSKSINDLKTSISGLSNFPWRYDIINSDGSITKGTGGVVGSIENIKNSACETFYWTIQPTHQSLFDQSGQVKITLDENNLIEETNENNNEKLYKGNVACNISQCFNSDFVMLSCIDDWADNKISQDNLLACQNLNFYTCSQSPALKGDLNGDSHVNGKDYSILEAVWSNNPTFNSANKKLVCADMNNSGKLDDFDLLNLIDILASCPNKGADGLGDCTASDLGLSNFEKQLASIRESIEAMLKDFLKR